MYPVLLINDHFVTLHSPTITMNCTLLLRTTLRLHDNPALYIALHGKGHHLRRIVIPILHDRTYDPRDVVPTLHVVNGHRPSSTPNNTAATAGITDLTTTATLEIHNVRFVAWKEDSVMSTAPQHKWGYHQFMFYLHAVKSFVRDVRRHVPKDIDICVLKGTAKDICDDVSNVQNGEMCICDVADDVPMWGEFDKVLQHSYRQRRDHSKLQFVVTHTLLDWRDGGEHALFLSKWSKTKHAGSFRKYVARNMQDVVQEVKKHSCAISPSKMNTTQTLTLTNTSRPINQQLSVRTALHQKKSTGGKKNRTRTKTQMTSVVLSQRPTNDHSQHAPRVLCVQNIQSHTPSDVTPPSQQFRMERMGVRELNGYIERWCQVFRERGVVPYIPPDDRTSCEAWALEQLEQCAAVMASDTWNKPSTASALDILQYATDPQRNTSKLSPFFAIGVLSPRLAYLKWCGGTKTLVEKNAARPSSAVAQLMWREEFHAASRVPGFWDTRNRSKWNTPSPPRFWKRDMDWKITKGNDSELESFLHGRTGYSDLDNALKVLVRDGWVHHLRRHIIADFLTRGKLRADWMVGESWFRQTLVDHDACLNRCNWLWLSACEFSTAQLIRHYRWDTYVKRQSAGVVLQT